MQKKNLKKGIVKRIDRENNAIVVLGPINKQSGLYLEKKLRPHCLAFDEDLKAEAFEFLRKTLVGREIEFNDYDVSGAIYADIFLDGFNVGYQITREGLARPHKMGERTSHYFEDLAKGDLEARELGKGQYRPEKTDLPGDKKTKKPKKQKLPALQDLLNKEISGYVEDVTYELDFQVYVHELEQTVKAGFAGLQIPVKSKEHVTALRNFLAKNFYQRDRKFKLKSLEDPNKPVLAEQNIADEASLTRKLLANGWARLAPEAPAKLETLELLPLKSLQDQATLALRGIWKDHKGRPPLNPEAAKTSGALHALLAGPAFEAVVAEVHSGDSLTVEAPGAPRLRVSLTNVRARPMGNSARGEEPQPWAFEAKEALRRKVIGKSVRVRVDNVRSVKTEEREFEVVNATIYLGEDPVAVDLLQKGLVALVPPKMSDPASPEIQKYAEAAQLAEAQKRGLHSNATPVKRFWDLSRPEARAKAREFNLESYKEPTEGVVEAVIAGTRFKIRLDKENCYFILSLNSVKSIPNNKNMPVQEAWAGEAAEFSKRRYLQRTVRFEVDTLDKHGVAHGAVFLDSRNAAEALLSAGLAFVERSFKNSRFINEYLALEGEARAKRKGIWGESELDLQSLNNGQGEGEEANEVRQVVLSEAFSLDDFYLQEVENPNMEFVAKVIREKGKGQENLAEPILAGTLALGLFDGQFYRVKVLKKAKKDHFEALFIDFGNRDALALKELKKCPLEIQKIPGLAFRSKLEYLLTPPLESMHAEAALEFFKKLTVDAKLVAEIKRREGGVSFVVLRRRGKEFSDIRRSVNMALVREGLAVVDPESSLAGDFDWVEAAKAGSLKNPDVVAMLNNLDY